MGVGETIYWADLHNHNEVGYGRGSLARAIEVAREHLDVFCFTPHGQWFDEANTPPEVHRKHQEGFALVQANWDLVRQRMNAAYRPGHFVTFLGHEWHSSNLGDYHIIYPGADHQIAYFDDIGALQKYVVEQGAIMVPHHVAYARGSRGIAWERFDSVASPVVEVFSEHGATETEWGLWPTVGHSMGPASSTQTVRHGLERGLVFGFTASSDDHLGYPGAYGEGLTGILADGLTRESIFTALTDRRTYAVTGDRIGLQFQVDDAPMGSVLERADKPRLRAAATLEDEAALVEVIKNGRVWRQLPCLADDGGGEGDSPVEFRLRIEWGWGGMEEQRVTDWRMRLSLSEGEIVEVVPHFQSGPFGADRRNRVVERGEQQCAWESYTSRRQAFRGVATNSLVLTIVAPRKARLTLESEQPAGRRVERTVAESLAGNHVERMGPSFSAETLLLHRALPLARLRHAWEWVDEAAPERPRDYYYLRVQQRNGQMAWSGPIWVEA